MSLVIKDKEGKRPHLALCHEAQGFSANNRSVSLLMKSGVELTEDITKALEVLGINKAAFYSQLRTMLHDAVKMKYGDDDKWLYVEDFSDSVVIFCTEDGVFTTNYSLQSGDVVLDDLADPVKIVVTYEPTNGKMLLSEDAEEKLEEGVYSLVTKALHNDETKEHLLKMFEAQNLIKEKEVLALQEEIQKAVAAAEAILKAQVAEKEVALQKALEEVEAFKAEKQEAVSKARKEAIASVEKDEAKAEELFKSLESLAQDAFDVVIKSLKAKEDVVETSDLFIKKSTDVTDETKEPVSFKSFLPTKNK
jgi:hypothetical protein